MTDSRGQQSSRKSFDILLVEDNPGDVRLVDEALKSTDNETTLHVFTTGEDAIDLVTQGDIEELPWIPNIALVDLNLPGKDGCEVLKAIRADPDFGTLPVIMLSSSEDDEDIERCYDATANAYLTKPSNADEVVSLVETIESFWFEKAHLPPLSQ